jgi:hypothetical protein
MANKQEYEVIVDIEVYIILDEAMRSLH